MSVELIGFLFLGSTCIYPRMAKATRLPKSAIDQSARTDQRSLRLGKDRGTKVVPILRRQYGVLFHSAMPTNLYGPGDNYHPEHSHVLPLSFADFTKQKSNRSESVTIWRTGSPLREFLHVDDLADAIVHLLKIPDLQTG